MPRAPGLSILLIDACRAVGIPARMVGTPRWTDNSGNHSWVEVWDREWSFVGACEPSKLNEGWFIGQAAKADESKPQNRIYATSFKAAGHLLPDGLEAPSPRRPGRGRHPPLHPPPQGHLQVARRPRRDHRPARRADRRPGPDRRLRHVRAARRPRVSRSRSASPTAPARSPGRSSSPPSPTRSSRSAETPPALLPDHDETPR